jgi:hypothetical protein
MNQMTTFLIAVCGLSIMFFLFGLTPTDSFIGQLMHPESMTLATFGLTLLTLITATTGIILGIVYKNAELAVMSTVTPIVAALLYNISSVITVFMGISAVFTIIIFSPLMVVMIVTLIDYWRGRD